MMQKVHFTLVSLGVVIATNALAQANSLFLLPVSAPTLDEVGLGLLVVALGVIGGFFARRKK